MAYSEASAGTDHPIFDEYGHPIEVGAGGFCGPFDPNRDRRHWKKNELSKPLHLIFEYSTTTFCNFAEFISFLYLFHRLNLIDLVYIHVIYLFRTKA